MTLGHRRKNIYTGTMTLGHGYRHKNIDTGTETQEHIHWDNDTGSWTHTVTLDTVTDTGMRSRHCDTSSGTQMLAQGHVAGSAPAQLSFQELEPVRNPTAFPYATLHLCKWIPTRKFPVFDMQNKVECSATEPLLNYVKHLTFTLPTSNLRFMFPRSPFTQQKNVEMQFRYKRAKECLNFCPDRIPQHTWGKQHVPHLASTSHDMNRYKAHRPTPSRRRLEERLCAYSQTRYVNLPDNHVEGRTCHSSGLDLPGNWIQDYFGCVGAVLL
ncbi:hypothetical protein NDU88_000637 [Pleurodeles waltl]|uniref:Uncharacterized protein n=1 Tax=Pleurodeles waltl TaxID=8319 RepID=A0AAV7LXD4_PLEWA|nr:hypothetical protein NDU88_000637 [Pleurodeles waltl]